MAEASAFSAAVSSDCRLLSRAATLLLRHSGKARLPASTGTPAAGWLHGCVLAGQQAAWAS